MTKSFEEILAHFDVDHAYDGDDVIGALRAAREAVGGNPAEWWVECNGERVKIGDTVQSYGIEHDVFALGPERVVYDLGHHFDSLRADLVHKVIPDTRKRIISDTIDKLSRNKTAEGRLEIISDAVDRAIKLPEVDE